MGKTTVRILGKIVLEILRDPDEYETEEEPEEGNSRLTTSDHSFGFIKEITEDWYNDDEE